MSDENDPVATAFDALLDDTRGLDTAEPLRSLGEARTGVGRRPLLLCAVTVAVLVIVGVVLFRDSGDGDSLVGPAGEPGLDDGQQDLSPADPATLVGSTWTLVSGTGPDGVVPLVDGWPITLTFDLETLGGTAACNGYGADYSLDGSLLTIDAIGRNAAGCADPVAASEAAFLAAIADTDSLLVSGNELILSGPSTELRFRDVPPVPTAELVGRLWLLETLVQDETASSVRGDPATLNLDSDGTFVGGTGCRTLSGDYLIAGGQVVFNSFGADGDCPSQLRDQDDIVVSVLSDGFTADIDGDRLTLTSVGNEGLTYRSVTEAEFGSLTGGPVVADAELLPGTTWVLRQGEGPDGPIDIIAGFEPVISFQADDTVTGNTSCNDFSADFAADGNRLSFRTFSRTVQGCFELGVVEAESAFRAALVDVSDFATEADGDELVLTGDATELVFDRAESTVLSAPTTVDLATTPDGRFRYSVTYPGPRGSRSNGILIVDDGSGAVPALRDERDELDEVHDMIFGPDGLVAWVSDDANYGSWMFLGRIDETGRIVDSRRVGDLRTEVMVRGEFDDTMLVGQAYGGLEIVVDTENDPFFVMSADPVPAIETDAPLVPVLESDGYWAREQPGFWYRGDTLGREPACGASTLYKDDADGFARVLDASIEIETVVDVDVDEDFGTGGIDTVGAARAVVLSTECPSQYEGRRVYWGIETIDYGDRGPRVESPLIVEPAPHSPVAEVLSVTAVIPERDCCPWPSMLRIDVELLDGTTTTIDVEV